MKTNLIHKEVWEKICENEKLIERVTKRNTVMQTFLLKSIETGCLILVANTHLYFHPDADHVRLIQGILCIQHIQSILEKQKIKVSMR